MTGMAAMSGEAMSEPSNLSRIKPATIHLGMRVRSGDYGDGTVVAMLGAMGIQVFWDQEILGTREHVLSHDRSYVERLEKL